MLLQSYPNRAYTDNWYVSECAYFSSLETLGIAELKKEKQQGILREVTPEHKGQQSGTVNETSV
jgi:hypothetical protein